MYFCIEYQGERRVVKAKATATVGEVAEAAFGQNIDLSKIDIIGASRHDRTARAMMAETMREAA